MKTYQAATCDLLSAMLPGQWRTGMGGRSASEQRGTWYTLCPPSLNIDWELSRDA